MLTEPSDILAELPLPQSGILAYEADLPYPDMNLAQNAERETLEDSVFHLYLGQLYLRKHLNTIHSKIYHPKNEGKRILPGSPLFEDLGRLMESVATMDWLYPPYRFHEDDPPADNILAARLRAKYWGSQVITYRPFIKEIFEDSHKIINGQLAIDPQVLTYAEKGIRALMESTRAFHNVDVNKRLIVTNIFGTAHA